jgi:hypothetical protein
LQDIICIGRDMKVLILIVCRLLLGGIFILVLLLILYHFAWECWIKWLFSFLFFTIMIVSCSPIYFCQIFLCAINLSHFCTGSVSFSFFHSCKEPWLVFDLVFILMHIQTTGVCISQSSICLPDIDVYC